MKNYVGILSVTTDGNIFLPKQENNWISVKDKLPELPYLCLMQFEQNNSYTTGYYDGHYWRSTPFIVHHGIIAWQPLPEPYQL